MGVMIKFISAAKAAQIETLRVLIRCSSSNYLNTANLAGIVAALMGINPHSSSESVVRRLMHNEQRHEAEIYVQLLVTVKERAAWIVGDEIELELRAALAEAGPSFMPWNKFSRPVHRTGFISFHAILGGLHHHYVRA